MESPDLCVFWISASSRERFEYDIRDTLNRLKVPGRLDPKANIFQLLRTWLLDARKGKWLIVLDNLDDPGFLLEPPSTTWHAGAQGPSIWHRERLIDTFPVNDHGSTLITTRSRAAALHVVAHRNTIHVEPMDEQQACSLIERKLASHRSHEEISELARALDSMPLAISQAASYIRARAPRFTVQQYVSRLKKSEHSLYRVLGKTESDLRRDRNAENSIFKTWQLSFNHIQSKHPAAADLLSLLSCYDGQAIPESLWSPGSTRTNEHTVDRAQFKPKISSSKHHGGIGDSDSDD